MPENQDLPALPVWHARSFWLVLVGAATIRTEARALFVTSAGNTARVECAADGVAP